MNRDPNADMLRRALHEDNRGGGGAGLPIRDIVRALVDRADELGWIWRLRPGTVTTPGPDGQTRIIYDGDTVALDTVSLVGRLPEGARVMGLLTPPAGNHILGFLGYDFPASVPGEAVGRPRLIILSADFPRANDTLTTVPGFEFTVVPGGQYIVKLRVAIYGVPAADAKLRWVIPAGASQERMQIGIPQDVTAGSTSNKAADVTIRRTNAAAEAYVAGTGGVGTDNGYMGYWEDVLLNVATVGGVVQLQFAQFTTTGGSPSILRARSGMEVQRYR